MFRCQNFAEKMPARQAQSLLYAEQPEAVAAMLRPHLAAGSGAVPLWRVMAQALRREGLIEAAARLQAMVVAATPGDATARFELADSLLLQGDFDRGWGEYAFRYGLPHTSRIGRKILRPRWGGAPMPGKTLLLHAEQGFGDTFQFIRLARAAAAHSQARVVLEVNPEILSLARRALPEVTIMCPGEAAPDCDAHCELLSLPLALGLSLRDLPGPMPYLLADPELLNHWRARLKNLPRPLVALAWAGRPTHPNDANRSITLAALAPLAATGAHFLSIQKGPAAAQAAAPPPGMCMTQLSGEIADFEDTAAILCVADLLISVDSSPVHLAGALGRPAWVMLPSLPDWRWLMHRDDSPWYPTHRLFRQSRRGDWDGVAEAVAAALRQQQAAGRKT
jgi:hypothetical protein